MSRESAPRRPLTRVYHDRIGETTPTDEPTGYWLFALGLVLAGLGLLLSIPSTPGSTLREWAIVLAASGLALLVGGPLIRLPLDRAASTLIALGLLGCAVAIGWYTAVSPGEAVSSQATAIVGTYVGGLAVMGVGGIVLPLTTARTASDGDAEAEMRALQRTLDRTDATDVDLAQTLAALRERVTEAEDAGDDRRRRTEALGREREDADPHEREREEVDPDEVALATRLRTLHESEARFELWNTDEEYRWRLRHRHGGVIATSDGGYPQRASAQRRIQSVRRDALGATLLYYETAADLPSNTDVFDPGETSGDEATIELVDAGPGVYRYRLRAEDGTVLAESGRGYTTRGGARTAMERLRKYAGPADYLEFDSAGVELYRDQTGEWRWRLVHSSGEVLAESGEGFASRGNAQRSVDRLRDTLLEATIEVYEDSAGEYRWRVRTRNGRVVADSGTAHDDREAAEEAVDRVRRYAPTAELLDVGVAAFEITAAADGGHRWRLRHRNGSILAESDRAHVTARDVVDAIDRVKRLAPGADIDS
jgi:uncharacterized protein YegP (UPF0339 family)